MKKRFHKSKRQWKYGSLFLRGLSVIFVSSAFAVIFMCYDMPTLNELETTTRRSSITFEAYDGTVIATYGDLFKKMVSLNEIPKHVYQSIIAIEDKRFYSHIGIDVVGVLRAAYNNFSEKKIAQGGSTITQQLAKNLFLTPSKSIKRKIQEAVLAFSIEKRFTKNQILTIYINRVYFGSGAYGVDAAAFRIFGKRAKDLKLYESAKLAACLKSPTTYSPLNNPKKSDERTLLVLHAMYDCGFISKNDLDGCISEIENGYFVSDIMSDNRYFTDWVFEQLPNVCTSNEDLIVRTTLDTRLQVNAVVTVRKALINSGLKNNATQMALVSIDKTGAVRAMVGGHTYAQSQFNRCLANRSPGSAFKFFVYLNALERGATPFDKILDAPIKIGKWSPQNYHWKPKGEISLVDAFAYSVNTAAVRIGEKYGVKNVIGIARRLGYESKIPDDMTMLLGSGGSSLLEMTKCYTCVMADGNKISPYGIMSIRTKSGKVIYRAKRIVENVVNKDICDKMKQLMRAVVKFGTGKRSGLGIESYGKSGTSNDSTDAWYIGFYDNLATGIWCGNDDNLPMNKAITGGTLPAETWRKYMQSVLYGNDFSTELHKVNITSDDSVTKKKGSLIKFINSVK